jgi:hypothetical protein
MHRLHARQLGDFRDLVGADSQSNTVVGALDAIKNLAANLRPLQGREDRVLRLPEFLNMVFNFIGRC